MNEYVYFTAYLVLSRGIFNVAKLCGVPDIAFCIIKMPTEVVCSGQTISQLRLYAKQLHALTDEYKDLIDSYVVEFFVQKRWEIFPKSWQAALNGLPPDNMANLLLDQKMPQQQSVWPLSLLAYRAATRALSLDPTPTTAGDSSSIRMDPTFKPIDLLCRLHVKAKKRHEILRMAEMINLTSTLANTERVVDVGSGQGHLSRLLSFGYGLKVTSIEAVGCHLTGAAKADTKIKTIIQKRIARCSNQPIDSIPHTPPQHVECTVHPRITVEEFLNVINHQSGNSDNLDQSKNQSRVGEAHSSEGQDTKDSPHVKSNATSTSLDHLSNEHSQIGRTDSHQRKESSEACHKAEYEASNLDSFKSGIKSSDTFVLAGLHTCGDLAPTMLRVFSKCAQARALTSVACCYMKMKCAIPPHPNVSPLSSAGGQVTVQDRNSRKRNHSASSQDSSTLDDSHIAHEIPSETEPWRPNANSDDCPIDVDRTLNLKGFPMSEFVQSLGGKSIQFEAMELACHSLESYRKRLIDRNPNLILHGYRATLEVVIQEFDRQMTQSHSGICKIKKAVASIRKPHLKTFEEYAASVLDGLNIPFEDHRLTELRDCYLPEWTNVITFHVIRSMMGPIIESLILLDRVLYLFEQGIESKLVPVFDAGLSPRNFVLVAVKDS